MEKEVNNNIWVNQIIQINKTEINMETTETKTEKTFIELNESNSNIIDVLSKVHQSIGSIFTKEDVLAIIRSIETTIDEEKPIIEYENLIAHIKQTFSDLQEDIHTQFEELVDLGGESFDNYKLAMNDHEVYIESANLNVEGQQSEVVHSIKNAKQSIINFINQES